MTRRTALLLPVLLAGCTGAALLHRVERASATAGDVTVRMPWALQPFKNAPAAVYFRVLNHGAVPDTLDAVSSPLAGMAMLHGTGSNGAMTPLTMLPIPAGDSIVLRPGVLHVMLEQLHRQVLRGDSIVITLHFRRAGSITVAAPVLGYDDLDKYATTLK